MGCLDRAHEGRGPISLWVLIGRLFSGQIKSRAATSEHARGSPDQSLPPTGNT